MLSKITQRVRTLPLILCLTAFALGITTAIAINVFNIPAIIAGTQVEEITAADIQQGKLNRVIFIDVRTPEEYQEDHIGNSPLIPITDIEAGFGIKQVINLIPNTEPKPTLVLYCAKGPRSNKAYQLLQETGLKMVVLKGGITEWRKTIQPSQDNSILNPILSTQKSLKRQ
ncbi:rhodanese-like domain-containing protein [Ancylothrix sp. C2]|uniref:rhodanese-like domain-containing protein n=1 Tax=Ancylothrix sp. D3o TaxID=2953691 RepID=UPI0021BAD2D1|nr:rhodanese-like domain-containing protein [Ancylothrix sp. D3o]MCT7950608.1 rhodanese-like domain-containing protein [Ancylothrix sp. D3o]